jgi:hypothetical protein
MSLTGFYPIWDKILSQNLQAVADQGGHFKGSSPYKGTACRGINCTVHEPFLRTVVGKNLSSTVSSNPI